MPTLFVATIGGHLVELVEIAARLPNDGDDVRVWATQDHPQSRSLLAGENVVYVPDVGLRDVPGVIRNLPVAHRLLREYRFTRVVSTGSGTALGFLPYLAVRGVSAHYVECATRLDGPSVTGNMMRFMPGVHLYTQWQRWAHGRWHYGGCVLDGFTSGPVAPPGVIRRAVVTVGTMPDFAFRSLFDALAPLLRPGGALEVAQGAPVETLWQSGVTVVVSSGNLGANSLGNRKAEGCDQCERHPDRSERSGIGRCERSKDPSRREIRAGDGRGIRRWVGRFVVGRGREERRGKGKKEDGLHEKTLVPPGGGYEDKAKVRAVAGKVLNCERVGAI